MTLTAKDNRFYRQKPPRKKLPAPFTPEQLRILREEAHAAARREIAVAFSQMSRPASRRGGC